MTPLQREAGDRNLYPFIQEISSINFKINQQIKKEKIMKNTIRLLMKGVRQ